MGRYFIGFVTVLLLLLPFIQADSQWIKATGPSEGRIGRAVIDPLDSKTVYVSGSRFYRSSDGGKTFEVFSGFAEEAPLMRIGAMAFSRDKDGPIIMLNSVGGLIVSEDRGKTWKVSKEKKEIRYASDLQAGPKGSKVFYCQSHTYNFIARSDDNGESWHRCKGLPEEVTSVEHFVADRFDEDTISFMYRKDGKTHFMLSRDGGKSFTDVDFPPDEDFVASVSTDPGDPELLYVCTQENGWGRGHKRRYFYSYDDGKTWELFFDPNSGDVLTKPIDAKLHKVFPDISRSPAPFRGGLMLNRNDVSWSEDQPGLMLASLRGRLFRSEDFGTTWEKTGKGIVAGVAYHIVLDPNDPQSAYCADYMSVWHTADRGKTWERMSLDDYWYLRHIRYSSNGKDVFVTSNGIWKGTSDGKSWEKKWSTNNLNRRPHGIFMKTTKNDDGEAVESMVVAVSKFLLESTDGGEQWKEAGKIDLEFHRGQGPWRFAQMRTDGKDVWYADSANGLVQSADYGKTWEELKDVPRERRFWSLGPDGSLWSIDRRYLYIFVGKETRIALPYDSSRVYPKTVMVDPQDAETAYVGMSDGSIVRITGRGTRVEKLKGGPNGFPISSLAVSPHDGSLWVGTDGNGVWILESQKKHPRRNTPPADIPAGKKETIPRTAIVRLDEVLPADEQALSTRVVAIILDGPKNVNLGDVVSALRRAGFAGGVDAAEVATLGEIEIARRDGRVVRLSDVAQIVERRTKGLPLAGGYGPLTRATPGGSEILLLVTGPYGSKLEFRVAPKPSDLDKAELASYMNWLKAGKVGFWWKGGRIAGRMPDHAWLPISGELTNAPQLVTGEHNGQKYVLVSDKLGQTMVPGKGNDAWGLAKVYATKDDFNQPAIGFELDARGAELFAALTKANINNALAMIVDGKVVSAPIIKTALGKTGMITGRFTEQDVNALVQALRAEAAAPGSWSPSTPKAGDERWDQEMIREAASWRPLLVRYSRADHAKNWPERRKALETIVSQHSNSQWVDDAQLALACGMAAFENDAAGAITLLDAIIAGYPDASTIVVGYRPDFGCEFDMMWVMCQGSLVSLNDDGTIRKARPYDRYGEIGESSKERLAYFHHLRDHPRKTTVVAKVLQAQILYHAGQEDKAVVILDGIIADARKTIATTAAADREAAQGQYGWHILCRLWRPEYLAWRMRAGLLAKTDPQKSTEFITEVARTVSPDGWHWRLNRLAGTWARQNKQEATALEQYGLAARGLQSAIKKDQDRTVDRLPPAEGSPTLTLLERRLAEVQRKIAQ